MSIAGCAEPAPRLFLPPGLEDGPGLCFDWYAKHTSPDTIKAESVSLVWAIAEAVCGISGKGPYRSFSGTHPRPPALFGNPP